MRPSMVQVATTPSTDRAFWSSCGDNEPGPFELSFLAEDLAPRVVRGQLDIIGRGFPFEVLWPWRRLRSMHSLVRFSPSLSLATDRTALSVSV